MAGPDGGRRSGYRARAAENQRGTGLARAGSRPAGQTGRRQRAPGRLVTVRPVRLLGDPVLRTPCDLVTRFDGGLANLIADLIDTVREPGRAGLAANQIGSSLAAFSYHVDGQLGYVINPRVVSLSDVLD